MNVAVAKPARKPAEPAVMPETIRQKVAESKAKLARLTNRQLELAEKSVLSPAGEAEYLQVVDEMSRVSGDLERYELAIASLDAKAKQQLKAAEAAEIRSLQGRVADMLDRRLEAARAFEESVTAAVAAMRQLAALGKAAWSAWPGAQPDHGVVFGGDELTRLIAAELARLGSVAIPTGGAIATEMALPAPRAPSILTVGAPDMIEPLVVAIGKANEYGKLALGGG